MTTSGRSPSMGLDMPPFRRVGATGDLCGVLHHVPDARRPLHIDSEGINFSVPVESPVSSPGPAQHYRSGPPLG